uniref:Uncharacterized protein n=1 Tax=Triticum urartu TaxID=4572 RepID=A0A8R7Q854_TRIUA
MEAAMGEGGGEEGRANKNQKGFGEEDVPDVEQEGKTSKGIQQHPQDFPRYAFSGRQRSCRRRDAYDEFLNLKMIWRLNLSKMLIRVGYALGCRCPYAPTRTPRSLEDAHKGRINVYERLHLYCVKGHIY